MYTGFYALKAVPFQLNPDHRFYFDQGPHRKALAYLRFGLSQAEGFVVITGEVGAGKTTLIDHVLAQIQDQDRMTAKVDTTQLEAEDFLRMVAFACGLEEVGTDKATNLRRIESFLRQVHRSGKRALLFVDEVQNLPYASLEELRMLSNFHENQSALLQIYLVGQPDFKKTLMSRDLEQLRQRVIANHHLRPLNAEETADYIRHRLLLVEWKNDPAFTDQAMGAIFEETGGVPRRINLLCSRLLLFGCLEGLHEIDAGAVREVVADMKEEGLPLMSAAETGRGNLSGEDQALTLALGMLRLENRMNAMEDLVGGQGDKLDEILEIVKERQNGPVGDRRPAGQGRPAGDPMTTKVRALGSQRKAD